MERPAKHRKPTDVRSPASSLGGAASYTQAQLERLTNRAFLVGEEQADVGAVSVGDADVVPICPVQLSDGGITK